MSAGSLANVVDSLLVGVSHFAECMRNANKSPKIPYSTMMREVEK